MSKPNRITASRPDDLVKTRLTDYIVGGEEVPANRFLHFGEVIAHDDKNANRLRVRIPLIDNTFYLDDNGDLDDSSGDDSIPWCISSNRIIDTPEIGSVVVVMLFDPQAPYLGRMWLAAVPELSSTDIFDSSRLGEELEKDWQNAEDSIGVKFNSTPGLRKRDELPNKDRTTQFKTGIKGKDKNKLLFDEGKTTLIQNEGEDNESKLELDDDAKLHSSNKIEVLNTDSQTREQPPYADPLYDYLDQVNGIVDEILNTCVASPGTGNYGMPVVGSPSFAATQASFAKVKARLSELKQAGTGKSEFITIN